MSSSANSSDAAVTALVGHMNEVETRRRLLMMRVKEAETRLAHLEDDGAAVAKEGSVLGDKEAAAKTRLAQLQGEQRVLSLQLCDGTGQLRKAETEEPFLMGNAQEQGKQTAQHLANWQAQVVKLDAVKALWSSNSLTGPLLRDLEGAEEAVAALVTEEKVLVEAIATAMVESSRAMAGAPNASSPRLGLAPSSTSSAPLASSDPTVLMMGLDTPRCKAQLAHLERSIAEEEAVAARIGQGLQREVDGLREREAELQKWVDVANAKAKAASTMARHLTVAMEERVCRVCNPPAADESA